MSNRGSRGAEFARLAGGPSGRPMRQPPLPGWRVPGDPAPATVPQPHRLGPSGPPPYLPVRPPAGAAPPPARPVSPPSHRDRLPGGTALDSLDECDDDLSERSGWRELVHRLTRIDLGPGKDSRYEHELRTRIRTVVGGAFPIAVLNLKGGVGKTAVVEALGSTFAHVRHDRVIAVDIDAGDLAERHGRRNPLNMADLLADDTVTEYGDVRAHTYMNSFGLEVLGLPDYARTDWRLERRGVAKAFSVLRQHYSVILIDCPKSLNSPEMEAVLPESRALVVVTSTSRDAIRKTRTSLEWLRHNGYRSLLKSTVLVINHVEPARVDNVAAKELEQLSAHVAATVVLPFDRHIHGGQQISLDRLSRESRRSYLEMAATLADMFPGSAAKRDLHLGSAGRPRRY